MSVSAWDSDLSSTLLSQVLSVASSSSEASDAFKEILRAVEEGREVRRYMTMEGEIIPFCAHGLGLIPDHTHFSGPV